MNHKIKITLITKLECAPCKGAAFILQKLKLKYDIEVASININANNKITIYEQYNLDNTKIPSIFVQDKLITYGKINENAIVEEIERNLNKNI